MDTASTIIGLGLLLAFIGPIGLLIIKEQKKQHKNLDKLIQLSRQYQIQPGETEYSNSLMLGLDRPAKKLLVVEPQNNHQHRVIDLSQIKFSKIKLQDFPHKKGKINQVSLELFSDSGTAKTGEILFYDEDDNENTDPANRLLIARKWERLVNSAI